MTVTATERAGQRTAALTAGISLLLMALAAAFSYGFVHGSLVIPDDAAATYHNIATSPGLFTAGIMGWLLILVCDIAAAWALYLFLKPASEPLSLLGAWLRLGYTAFLGIAIMNLIYALLLTSGPVGNPLPAGHLEAHLTLYLRAFESIWSLGLIVFGGHLLLLCLLCFRSDQVPRLISILLLPASIGYILVHLSTALLPSYEEIVNGLELIFMIPMAAGELGFAIWLLLRGGKTPVTGRRQPASDAAGPVS